MRIGALVASLLLVTNGLHADDRATDQRAVILTCIWTNVMLLTASEKAGGVDEISKAIFKAASRAYVEAAQAVGISEQEKEAAFSLMLGQYRTEFLTWDQIVDRAEACALALQTNQQ